MRGWPRETARPIADARAPSAQAIEEETCLEADEDRIGAEDGSGEDREEEGDGEIRPPRGLRRAHRELLCETAARAPRDPRRAEGPGGGGRTRRERVDQVGDAL